VTLVEREKFPRDKLCGEFISPECIRHFDALEIGDNIRSAGGSEVFSTRFFSQRGHRIDVPSDWFLQGAPAISLSRAAMDELLIRRAIASGVRVHEDASVVGISLDRGTIREVNISSANGPMRLSTDLIVDATGRPRILSKLVDRHYRRGNPMAKKPGRYLAFKAHFQGAQLDHGTCAIYSFAGGYCGLTRIELGSFNLCLILKVEEARHHGSDADKIVANVIAENKKAAASLQAAKRTSDWLTVSISEFGQRDVVPARNLFLAGDSGAFIDPFTGSGILMALESSEILSRCMVRSPDDPDRIGNDYRLAHSKHFAKRLNASRFIRFAAYNPTLAGVAIGVLGRSLSIRRFLTWATRDRSPQ
ncbi:MAG: hypothetical protein WBD22_10740, partial [Pyrinomonadaceae bacterium]